MTQDSLKQAKILIIDDQPFIRSTIRQMLVMIGIQRSHIHDANAVDTGMKETLCARPNVILCDVHMPGENGLVFLEKLRGSDNTQIAATPVIMLTSDMTENTVVAAKGFQVSGYLLKPISAVALQRALEDAIKFAEQGAAH